MWGLEWALHFEYRCYAGQREQALAMLAARRGAFPRPGEPAGWGPWLMLTSAVEGLVVLGEQGEAAGLYPLVRHCQARTRRFFAAMLLARGAPGDREQALRLISEAEALYRRMGMPKLLAITQALRA